MADTAKTANILTLKGGEFSIGDELREILCYLDDGRLIISKSHQFNPHVRGFMARLDRQGRKYQTYTADLAAIAKIYASAASDQAKTSASDMQRIASSLFDRAVEVRASDIHIRISKRGKTQILFRVHNFLEFVEEHSFDYGDQLCTTIYQAMADVSDTSFEPLNRQDARISDRAKIPERLDGIRLATSPQVDGYIMVMRLLYNDTTDNLELQALGYNDAQDKCVGLMKRSPTGINVISGPTGSGKSTTLQRVLASVIKETKGRKHIITVEDPPEYPIPGAVQSPVANADTEEDRSAAFQKAIKAAMRLDPDVIMIGEVRDAPSAKLAVQAAMTGHQVWTTVHANSAIAIIDRLIDLGVPMQLVLDPTIITGFTCQRLLNVLCPECKKPLADVLGRYSDDDIQRIMRAVRIDQAFVVGDGCPHCSNRGTIDRTVVAETINTNYELMSYIRKDDRLGADEYLRRIGFTSMMDHAIEKINAGIVDPFMAEPIVGMLNVSVKNQEV